MNVQCTSICLYTACSNTHSAYAHIGMCAYVHTHASAHAHRTNIQCISHMNVYMYLINTCICVYMCAYVGVCTAAVEADTALKQVWCWKWK